MGGGTRERNATRVGECVHAMNAQTSATVPTTAAIARVIHTAWAENTGSVRYVGADDSGSVALNGFWEDCKCPCALVLPAAHRAKSLALVLGIYLESPCAVGRDFG